VTKWWWLCNILSLALHYGTNAVFFYLEMVLFLCFKHRTVFFRAKLHLKLGILNRLRGILTKTVLFLCEKHWNAVLKTLESGVFYTTLYRSATDRGNHLLFPHLVLM
jgi:hypothetical protein